MPAAVDAPLNSQKPSTGLLQPDYNLMDAAQLGWILKSG
jgi:hypothetical protein